MVKGERLNGLKMMPGCDFCSQDYHDEKVGDTDLELDEAMVTVEPELLPEPECRLLAPTPSFGRVVHPTLQKVECPVQDIDTLCQTVNDEATLPLLNWAPVPPNNTNSKLDVSDIKTWFPCDDHVAFYTPVDNGGNDSNSNGKAGRQYERLTYRQLHETLDQCPPFSSFDTDNSKSNNKVNVAISIPSEQMAHMAVALLSTMAHRGAVAVPLDPRMPVFRVLQAMEQLDCTCLVVSKQSGLVEGFNSHSSSVQFQPLLIQEEMTTNDNCNYCYKINPLLGGNKCDCKEIDSSSDANQHLLDFFTTRVHEIRVVTPGTCGRLVWTVLRRVPPSASGSEVTWTATTAACDFATRANQAAAQEQQIQDPSNDVAMLLRTSGTTSTPKVVPISRSMILYAGICIAATLELKRDDCNCNSMPFFHIGGIACNLMAVLVSGGSVVMAGPLKDPNDFLDHLNAKINSGNQVPSPTWYYAGPSMHKAIVLMAEAKLKHDGQGSSFPNNLRFIRSASAHLNHDLALRLSSVFQCQVIPTYGMSEAMPICSSAPIDVRRDPPCQVLDSVGFPTGTSVSIRQQDTDEILEYGSVGEICVKGPGVISHYIGIDKQRSHTRDGWLRTGDHGVLDQQGRLFIKGRSKEMIKRGGEQVWPNEIDDVVEKVEGVATALAFGVPNELWGEEVAVAVVLSDPRQLDNLTYLQNLEEQIMATCRKTLDTLSLPHQIKFLSSTDDLLKGPTGKYLRSKMAAHLGILAVDTGALRILNACKGIDNDNTNTSSSTDSDKNISLTDSDSNISGRWSWLNYTMKDGKRIKLSEALNGVRFLVACFVVQGHVGLFPNMPWVKLQSYQPNMPIFFALAAFQTTCGVARSVQGQWASFVGTKIGSLHCLFVIAQLFGLPAFILFMAFDEEGNWDWTANDWIKYMSLFAFDTCTGLAHGWSVIGQTWFQSVYYMFLVFFPFVDEYLRYKPIKIQATLLVIFSTLAASLLAILYIAVPSDVFWGYIYMLSWTMVTWFPLLIASMLAAYLFRWMCDYYFRKRDKACTGQGQQGQPTFLSVDKDTLSVEDIKDYSKVWGVVCDVCSLVLLLILIVVLIYPNCLCVYKETFAEMRPYTELPQEQCAFTSGSKAEEYVWTCDITQPEFANFIQPDPNHDEVGRFATFFSGAMGYLRISSPLFLLWIASMASGNGYTARFFSSGVMTSLAPLGYPVYLLHVSVARYYWVATRGVKKEEWFYMAGEYPFPVEWWEFFIILVLTVAVAYIVNTFLVPPTIPYSISLGVKVCTFLSRTMKRCCHRFCRGSTGPHKEESETSLTDGSAANEDCGIGRTGDADSTHEDIRAMVRGLTGVEVTRSMRLQHLGLDSLGAMALLGMLRASVPAAKNLSLLELQKCETVGCLVDLLSYEGRPSSDKTSGWASPSAKTSCSSESNLPTSPGDWSKFSV